MVAHVLQVTGLKLVFILPWWAWQVDVCTVFTVSVVVFVYLKPWIILSWLIGSHAFDTVFSTNCPPFYSSYVVSVLWLLLPHIASLMFWWHEFRHSFLLLYYLINMYGVGGSLPQSATRSPLSPIHSVSFLKVMPCWQLINLGIHLLLTGSPTMLHCQSRLAVVGLMCFDASIPIIRLLSNLRKDRPPPVAVSC